MRGAKEVPPPAVTRGGLPPGDHRSPGRADAEPTGARPPKARRSGPPWRNKDRAATSGGPSPARADDGRADGEEAMRGPARIPL